MYPEARQNKVIVTAVDDELIVYDETHRRAILLNAMASRIWRQCDGASTPEEIAARIPALSGLDAGATVVQLGLKRLTRADLLLDGDVKRASSVGVTRRALMHRAGLIATMGLILPAITILAAPTPAMAASRPANYDPDKDGDPGRDIDPVPDMTFNDCLGKDPPCGGGECVDQIQPSHCLETNDPRKSAPQCKCQYGK